MWYLEHSRTWRLDGTQKFTFVIFITSQSDHAILMDSLGGNGYMAILSWWIGRNEFYSWVRYLPRAKSTPPEYLRQFQIPADIAHFELKQHWIKNLRLQLIDGWSNHWIPVQSVAFSAIRCCSAISCCNQLRQQCNLSQMEINW